MIRAPHARAVRGRGANPLRLAVNGPPDPDLRIVSFNANGLRSAASKGFFDWFAHAGRRRAVRAGNQGAGAPARRRRASCPHGYRAWFRDATTKKGYSGVAIYAQARAGRGPHRAGLGAVRRRRPLHRGALRQPQRGVVLHPVGFVGRGAPGLQVRGDGVAQADPRPVAAQRPRLRAVRRLEHRAQRARHPNWKSNQKNSGCLPRGARLAQRPVRATGTAAGSTPTARCMPKARTTPGGATAAPRARRTSAGASTTSS